MTGLRIRVVLTMLAVAVVACALTIGGLAGPVASMAMNRSVTLLGGIPEGELDRCEADPDGWVYVNAHGMRAYAFDREQVRARHRDAPPATVPMRIRLFLGEREPAAMMPRGPFGASMLRDTDRTGPCATVWLLLPETEGRRQALLSQAATWAFLVGLTTLVLGWWTTIRPVLAQVERAHDQVRDERDHLIRHQSALEQHLADVAHDLKTPLAALQLRLDQLTREPDPETLDGALSDVVYLGMLTENLGAAGRLQLEDWTPERTPVDLGALVRRVAERMAALGRRGGVTVDHAVPDGPLLVTTGALQAEQVVANLVHNAVVHNRSGGRVAVVLDRTASGFKLEVADDGPGVPVERLGRIRERGVQLGGTGSGRGAGLGLAISSELCAKLDWSISLENVEPTGFVATISGGLDAASTTPQQRHVNTEAPPQEG